MIKTLSFLILIFFFQAAFAQKSALVIIDMQPFFAERAGRLMLPGNPEKLKALLRRQRELIKIAKANGVPILLVEYASKGETHESLLKEIGDYKNIKKIKKATTGLFERKNTAKEFIEYVDGKKITDLVVSGANGGACVQCSIEGALDNGYNVWTDSRAIIDFESSEFQFPYHYAEETLELLFSERINNFYQAAPEDIEALLSNRKPKVPPSCEPPLLPN